MRARFYRSKWETIQVSLFLGQTRACLLDQEDSIPLWGHLAKMLLDVLIRIP